MVINKQEKRNTEQSFKEQRNESFFIYCSINADKMLPNSKTSFSKVNYKIQNLGDIA